jgi:signal transduction histidine kinase
MSSQPTKILLVEDAAGSPPLRDLLARLPATEVSCEHAASPARAAELLATTSFDAVLLALPLPGPAADAAVSGVCQTASAARAESLRCLLQSVDHLVFALDRDGRLTQVFGQWVVREGLDPAVWLGRTAAELFGAEAAPPHVAAHARALAGERVAFDWWLPSPAGPRHFEAAMAPLRGPDGRILGVAGFNRETTSERQSHADRLMAERMAPMGTFAGGVAHQINNPLATIMANLDYTLRELADLTQELHASATMAQTARLAELNEPLRDARDSADRIRRLVRDLQRFVPVAPERRGPVEVNPTIDALLALMWKEIQFRARLVKHLGSVVPVRASESRLRELFLNLIQNAAQAIPEGDPEHHQIRVATAMGAEGRVIVTIQDSGAGIAAEDLDRIFDPFFTTRPAGSSAGLGLSLCRRIVIELGGQISVESAVGRGATFRVTLPGIGVEPAQAAPELAPVGAARRGRVLVVDDEPALGKAVRRSLMADHDVSVVSSAREALARFAAGERFDVIISDLIMPGMTGMDLHAELMRADPEVAARMVFLTGGAGMPEAREFLARVPNPRVDKPFESKNLAAIVARLLR